MDIVDVNWSALLGLFYLDFKASYNLPNEKQNNEQSYNLVTL